MSLPTFHLRLPFVPTASKNSQRVLRIGGATRIAMNARAAADKKRIEGLALEQIARMGQRCGYLNDRDLRFRMRWDPWRGEVWCFVEDLGPATKIPGQRRDLSNMDAVILDALEGIAYANDHAIRAVDLGVDRQHDLGPG